MVRKLSLIVLLTALFAWGCDDGDTADAGPETDGDVETDGGGGGESCADGMQNQDESDVDCGGVCGATCRPGDMCNAGTDCTTGDCTGGTCGAAASCSDGRMNGMESDVDCGGPLCMACDDGQMCNTGTDCVSEVCSGGTCEAPGCGDGFQNAAAEECDGDNVGTGGETATCDADCTLVVCGDGTINMTAGEVCEEGGVESATCDTDCTAVMCGDGVVNTTAGEACDGDGMGTGGESATCNVDCTVASCGDGVVNAAAGETCDGDGMGTGGETATCDTDCTANMCGDGVLNLTAGEECDDGNMVDTDRCSNTCTAPPSVTVTGRQTFDTDTGLLDGMMVGRWVPASSTLQVGSLTVPMGTFLRVVGSNPFIVEASADITVAGTLDASGQTATQPGGPGANACNGPGGVGGAGGPGGFAGGDGGDGVAFGGTPTAGESLEGVAGMGPGAGGAGLTGTTGEGAGGGAGHIGAGTDGQAFGAGTGGAGGMAYSGLSPLRGGSGGGGGSGEDDPPAGYGEGDDGGGGGGGGGGAVRLDALNAVVITGTLDVSGGDGGDGCPGASGSGGGGSGGTVVIASGVAPDLSGTVDISGGDGATDGANGGDGEVGEIFIDGTCTDGRVNQDETDVDCGGATCGGCADGLACGVDGDCASMTCVSGTCLNAMCVDGMMNGTETDVDCGGAVCPACSAGEMCAAATDCVSGGCTAGTCDPEGHVVLIGHDYFNRSAAADLIVGNSVLLTQETGTIEILVYDQFGDLMREVPNTEAAITATLAPFRMANFTRLSDFGMLGATLTAATDVLLIPEQEQGGASASVMNSVGTLWRPDLEAFLDRGGVIIVCSRIDNGWRILDSAGLMTQTSRTPLGAGTLNVVDATDPIVTAVPMTYPTPAFSGFGVGLMGGRTVVEAGPGQPVVQHRIRGLP